MATVPATPQRQLPGAYFHTPALARTSSFRPEVLNPAQAPQTNPNAPVQRAATALNDALAFDRRFPLLEDYVTSGHSSDYEVPPASTPWAPFQRVSTYDIPDQVFEQYNNMQVATAMGLFAELHHAWMSIDNQLYLWDYTHPNPELLGYEEQPHTIRAVELVVPRAGVFNKDVITHVLVVATTADIFMIGLKAEKNEGGVHTVTLSRTNMQVNTKNLDVTCIAASTKSGRIFFAGEAGEDVHELTYQNQDGWFTNKCGKINHTTKGFQAVLPTMSFGAASKRETVKQLVVDDSRNMLYTLSSNSVIKAYHMSNPASLDLRITLNFNTLILQMGHTVGDPPSELLKPNITSLVAVVPIPYQESRRTNLMAVTSNGCRIYFTSLQSGYGGGESAPSSMQVRHVRFPPNETAQDAYPPNSNKNSHALLSTQKAARFSPGYFLAFRQDTRNRLEPGLFVSAPDSGYIMWQKISNDRTQNTLRYPEFGTWIQLGGPTEDVGLVTPMFAASTSSDTGFGNELAVQFDRPVTEIAVLTNAGVHTIRRRRLVDIFAGAFRSTGTDEELEETVKRFLRSYGREETTATALAVACGQATEVTTDARITVITDPGIMDHARRVYIEFGGKPTINENITLDGAATPIDCVIPSPRHQGTARYIARLVRSAWAIPIMQTATPTGGSTVVPTVPLEKLKRVQKDLTTLKEFLDTNKTFIDGLSGPEAMRRADSRQAEVALQGEHRAMDSLVKLISHIIEGISFVLVLFDERVDEILLSLPDVSRQTAKGLTFEGLFTKEEGKNLAKELVKAVVNLNIANGSNVDTVAEALRRRCGSFCSADDVVIFKAQEKLQKATEAGPFTEDGRWLLNESLKLFKTVAGNLSMEHLTGAVGQYVAMQFYAGAIQLTLQVAKLKDPSNKALGWIKEDCPQPDTRQRLYEARKRCYDLIHGIVTAVDEASEQANDGSIHKRREEAYHEMNSSDDEVFQNNLYDWYIHRDMSDRLLAIHSQHVVTYLQRKSSDSVLMADMLWKYYCHYKQYLDAAKVQLKLATSQFTIPLAYRIDYLSRARANASTRTSGVSDMGTGAQSRQEILREISDLLDIATIQEDLCQKIASDSRGTVDIKADLIGRLDGELMSLDTLFNEYIDSAGYFDLSLLCFHFADYRNEADISAAWFNFVGDLHAQAVETSQAQPYQVVEERVRKLCMRVGLGSSPVAPIELVLKVVLAYGITSSRDLGLNTHTTGETRWPVELLLDMHAPYEAVVTALERLFFTEEPPFIERARVEMAETLVYLCDRWLLDTSGAGGVPFGGEENAVMASDTMEMVTATGLLRGGPWGAEADNLRQKIARVLR
ncbi:nucleoporin Nup157/170 [Aulographum hederae CBS 113979]|uniref:Nucleoporin Nup157/170 n=1 Tax=Aulographum hederae CBS 113979 TaxID=1176131 RepID=A0A6G1GNS4_9PEZI|nr:nucleoporin Nup157/170 [Aulographum hederae CBS 113979]